MRAAALSIFMVTVVTLALMSVADDLRAYRIVSPSMEPNVPVGSLVIVSLSEPIEVGDIVAYRLDAMGRSYTLVHRVVDVGDGVYLIKADVNPYGDGEVVTRDRIIGKAVVVIPFLGYLAAAVIAAPALALIPVVAKGGGLGFPAAAFISILPFVLPLRGMASTLGNVYFTALTAGAVMAGRLVEAKSKELAEIIYVLAASVSIISVDVEEVVSWLA